MTVISATSGGRAGKQFFPNAPEPWEDFLDMSRWRTPPSRRVLSKRLVENCVLYSGNYLWLWLIVTAMYGLSANWRILCSFLTIAVGWQAIEMVYGHVCVEAPNGLRKKTPCLSLSKVGTGLACLCQASLLCLKTN